MKIEVNIKNELGESPSNYAVKIKLLILDYLRPI